MSSSANFVITIDPKLSEKITQDLHSQGFALSTPPNTLFSAKKQGVCCTLYTTGKLVVQGKAKAEFIEFYLEPLLGNFSYSYGDFDKPSPTPEKNPLNSLPSGSAGSPMPGHIGIDESGKGDFFGPLCIAGVYADSQGIAKLKALGVRDSKALSDAATLKLAKSIKAACAHHIVKINPQKYNELHTQFKNLNYLLAWGHATVIEQLVAKTGCRDVVVDQFANEHVVLTALKRKRLELNVLQRHRAEEDLVVAAASILARETFLLGLDLLGQQFGVKLPKGASAGTIAAGKLFVQKHGVEALGQVGKLHFKTTQSIL